MFSRCHARCLGCGQYLLSSGIQIFPSERNSRSTTSPGTLLRDTRMVSLSSVISEPPGLYRAASCLSRSLGEAPKAGQSAEKLDTRSRRLKGRFMTTLHLQSDVSASLRTGGLRVCVSCGFLAE